MFLSLPLSVRFSVLGLASVVALVFGAAAVRTPPYLALEAEEGASPSAPVPSASASAAPAVETVAAASTGRSPAPRPAVSVAAPAPLTSDARETRALLRKELEFGRYAAATAALARLLDLAPTAAEDADVRGDIVELSMRVMLLTGKEPDAVFDMIATKMGTTGIDILYELLTTRGGSRAAARADEMLREAPVRERGTPAMRIAYELRVTQSCDQKKALFPRAQQDGDGRALGQLQLMNRRCGRHGSTCCFQNDPELRAAMDGIKARVN